MSVAMLNAVPIVEASSNEEDHTQLVDVRDSSYTFLPILRTYNLKRRIYMSGGAGDQPEGGGDFLGE